MQTLEEFYDQYADKVYNFCFWRVADKQVAQDIVSQAFLQFMRKGGVQKSYPVAYLYKICRNLIIDQYRNKKESLSMESLVEMGSEPGVESNNEQFLSLSQVYSELQLLPEPQKEAILLHFVQDLDLQSVAKSMGKTEAGVKSLIYRGTETIRGRINL